MDKFRILIALLSVAGIGHADCPTPTYQTPQSWSAISVSYGYPTPGPLPAAWTDIPISSLGISDDIDSAFIAWTSANNSQNGTLISFYPYSGMLQLPEAAIYAYQVNYPGDSANGDPGKAAITTVAVYSGTRTIASTETVLYFGSINAYGFYPCWDQAAGAVYHNFVTKTMLHEIGHTMDLDDQPAIPDQQCSGQVAEQSVMNFQCNTNDSVNNQPMSVTNCDNSSAQ